MKRWSVAMGVVAVSLWSASLLAQGRNFAGNWTVDSEKTQAAMAAMASSGGGGSMVAVGGGGGGRGGVAVAGGGGAAMTSGGGGGMVAAGGGGRGGAGGGARGGGAPAPMTIALDATTFSIGTTAYKTDGSTTTIETATGKIVAKASWKADKLVIESTTENSNGTSSSTTTWFLDGESLVRETSRPSPDGGEPRVSKTFYKKA